MIQSSLHRRTHVLKLASAFVILCLLFALSSSAQNEETSLFDSEGTPVAYIAMESDGLIIYTWSGKPVAYLSSSSGGGMSVYGFNGKHLGWFVRGIVRNHDGDGACGVRGVVPSPKYEPFKSFKEFKPFKAFKEFEPSRPTFSQSGSGTPCGVLLYEGTE